MSRRIILTVGARTDLKSSSEWYRRIDVDLSLRFEQSVQATLLRIVRFPYAFPIARNDLRRARMDQFRYNIYFSVGANSVVIVTIVHQRREQSAWIKPRDR